MLELAIKIFTKPGKTILLDRLTNIRHQVQIIMQIMDGIKVITEYLPGLKKMPQIRPAIVSTGVTGAFFVKRTVIITKPGILDGNFTL